MFPDPKYGPYAPADMRILFNDSVPIMMATDVSHEDVNRRLRKQEKLPLIQDTWKANLFIKTVGSQRPYGEDEWGHVKLGEDVVMERVRPCNRCSVTTVDPSTGTYRSDGEPLRTLR